MKTVLSEDFQEIAVQALERMAFVFVEPGTETPGEVLARPIVSSRILIQGDAGAFTLCVSATHDFLAEVAGAMMGVDAEEIDADEHGQSTLNELANVLGGELVMAMGGDTDPYRLGLPDAITDEEVGLLADASIEVGTCLVLQSDSGGSMLLSWKAS
ncbi:MAG: hypothetical protein KDC98_05910 [Planctomycetes bacterium]|nr:hypothetical protein [Planctomycetota bacterium]